MVNVNSLVNSLEKVKVISSPFKRSLKWFALSVMFMVVVTCCFKVCLEQEMYHYPFAFYFESVFLVLVAFAAVLAAFLYSSPDEKYQKIAKKLSVFSIISWIGLFVYCIAHCLMAGNFVHMMAASLINYDNLFKILAVGLLPTIWLILMLRKAFPTHRKLVGVLSILGSLTLAIIFTRFLDATHEATHMLIWRYTPVLIIALVVYLLANKILKR